jgi:hypothetical protein
MFACLSLLVVSCTMQKRLHNPGWNVQWNKNYHSSSFVADGEQSVGQPKKTIFKDHPVLEEEEMTLNTVLIDSAYTSIIVLRSDHPEEANTSYVKIEKSAKKLNDLFFESNVTRSSDLRHKKNSLVSKSPVNGDPLFLLLFIFCGVVFIGLLLLALNFYTTFQVWLGLMIIGLLAYILALWILSILTKRLFSIIARRLNR